MEKLAVVLLLVWACQAEAGEIYPSIDCGLNGTSSVHYNEEIWFPDSLIMDSGKRKQVINSSNIPLFMTTLRYFPKHELNCYALSLPTRAKLMFRAGFNYANYDGKSQPPVFDLLLGGQLWAVVNSSASNEPIFHELMYMPKKDNISVCLRRRENGGTPFISSLETNFLESSDIQNNTIYTKVKNGTAYHLLTRLIFGYHKVIQPWSENPEEEFLNRYWMPQSMSGLVNLSFEPTIGAGWYYENHPPRPVVENAVAPQNASQSIHVSITLPNSDPQSTYMVLYFFQNLNASETANATRYMDIYVDGLVRANVKFETFNSGQVLTLYPILVQDIANLTISPANGTILPPLLNAMEVFIVAQLAEQSSYGHRISSSSILVSMFHFFLTLLIVLYY